MNLENLLGTGGWLWNCELILSSRRNALQPSIAATPEKQLRLPHPRQTSFFFHWFAFV
jgi:hypothetical protein